MHQFFSRATLALVHTHTHTHTFIFSQPLLHASATRGMRAITT